MTILQAIVLGLIQGISEFLPISSSGHLIIVPKLFGWTDQGVVFDVALHAATLIAILVVFRFDIKKMFLGFIGKGEKLDQQLAWMIIVGTIPVVIVGFLFNNTIETLFRSSIFVAINLAFWGVVLFIADRFAANRQSGEVTWKTALWAGLAQAIALIPGTSRSGITISAGLFTGLDRVKAARFSFLLGIPAIAGAVALTFTDAIETGTNIEWTPTIIGFIVALISGILSIRWLLKFISKTNYGWFTLYRILIAILILLFFAR